MLLPADKGMLASACATHLVLKAWFILASLPVGAMHQLSLLVRYAVYDSWHAHTAVFGLLTVVFLRLLGMKCMCWK